MKFRIKSILGIASIWLFLSCGNESHEHKEDHHAEHKPEDKVVHLSSAQFKALDMNVGSLPRKNISNIVQVNGQLEVPPQNEATVTAIVGANVTSIEVIEGDDVKKGQVLAYLSHPNITQLQSNYLKAYHNELFLEQEFQRQKRLYEEEVGAGKTFQETQANYRSAQASAKSFEIQLKQLGMDPTKVLQKSFYDQVPLVSPINGSITKVAVKTGQYVNPESNLFEIVNVEHIHADLMVFEKDVYKVEEGQRVRFTVETFPDTKLYAEIYSVGKKFEQNPKAIHVHAEIKNKSGKLIPGMYIRGEILTDSTKSFALPQNAITRDGEEYFVFMAEKASEEEWLFKPIQVVPGIASDGWVALKFLEDLPENAQFVMNKAYYLIAEMHKGEGGHHH